MDLGSLRAAQEEASRRARCTDALPASSVKRIAGFDVVFFDDQAVCAAVVLDAQTLRAVERKFIIQKTPMRYVPGFEAFREGALILQLYHDLEHEPDVLMLAGHGIAHPARCGVATYVGVELEKPTFGCAQALAAGELREDVVLLDGDEVGVAIKTHQYANPVIVSPGHGISPWAAAAIATQCVIPPHKMPEPLHCAHKYARQVLERLRSGELRETKVGADDTMEYDELQVGIDA